LRKSVHAKIHHAHGSNRFEIAAACTVGWICALPIKLAAAQVMINKEHLAHNTYSTPLHTGGGLWQIAVAGDALVQLLTEAWRAAPHRSIMQGSTHL
jgi:hypothetical protein